MAEARGLRREPGRIRHGVACAAWLCGLGFVATAGAQLWEVGEQALARDPAQAGANWGTVLASGLADADGFADLAVGEPLWDGPSLPDAGRVTIYRGAASGFGAPVFTDTYSQTGAHFGAALAFVDFDGGGRRSWLAVGIPGDSTLNTEAGRVYIYHWNGAAWVYVHYYALGVGGVYGGNGPLDHFGSVFAVGDFDDDGYEDLAVGVPDYDVTNSGTTWTDAGTVHVFYGSASGPSQRNQWLWLQLEPQQGANAGAALAAGDFDGDGAADLAIGVPGRNVVTGSLQLDAGRVMIASGVAGSGLDPLSIQTLNDGDFGGIIEENDLFGASLAAGDFDLSLLCVLYDSCHADLAIGVPGENLAAGAVVVGYGSASGVDPLDRQVFLQQDLGDGGSTAEVGDGFGSVLTAGVFDSLWGIDLAVGVPGEDWGPVVNQGVVHIAFGGQSGLTSHPGQWLIARPGLSSSPPAAEDRFGAALAAGNFNGHSAQDLAVGLPGRTRSGQAGAGLVQTLRSALFADGFESGGTTHWP